VRRRASIGGLLLALVAIVVAASPGRAGASGATPAMPSGALGPVTSAVGRTLKQTVTVSIVLAGARVFGSAPPPLRGRGHFDLGTGQGEVTMHGPSGTESRIFLPAAVFLHEPNVPAGVLPQGKIWISAGLTEYPADVTAFSQFVAEVEGVNPGLLLEQVALGAVSAVSLGQHQVAGMPATEYLVEVDLRRAASSAGATAPGLQRAIDYQLVAAGGNATKGGPVLQKIRVWVEGTGQAVQLQASPPGSGIGTTTLTVSRSKAGFRATTPPRATVVDIATLTPGGERELIGGVDSDAA
jgi:hypothetical protein